MIIVTISKAEFISGSPHLEDLPQLPEPEIAFIGRSNAGKSTLINRLLGRKQLARSSATPGKTQELNLYLVQASVPREKAQRLIFTDLPGFGYATFSKERREALSATIVRYIEQRDRLYVVCLLNDIRRDPEREEHALIDLAQQSGRHVLVIGTKADKLSRSDQQKAHARLTKAYNLPGEQILIAGEKMAPHPLLEQIWIRAGQNASR